LQAFAREAEKRGVDQSALALAWLLGQPGMDAAVIGPRSPAHLLAAVSAFDVELPSRDLDALSRLFPRSPA
jgi:aryl-alcohol dehydrogenase-like predicted oxidoreductase